MKPNINKRYVQFMGREWAWNPVDQKLLQVNDWIKDLRLAIDYVPIDRRGVAIQAGGAMGMWPYALSHEFGKVYTFEPDAGNYACLVENVADRSNVEHYHAALGMFDGFVRVELPRSEANNAGAYYTMPANEGITDAEKIPQFSLDTFLHDCAAEITQPVDFIQLDVEGREIDVLRGATDVLIDHAPVIMLEDKPLPQDRHTGHKFGEVERWLTQEMGYKAAARVHRDIVFVPGNTK